MEVSEVAFCGAEKEIWDRGNCDGEDNSGVFENGWLLIEKLLNEM